MKSIVLGVGLIAISLNANATQLITNGGFETGDLTGWNLSVAPGSGGDFFVTSGTLSPLNGNSLPGPAGGTFFAVTDQGGPGTYALAQAFTVNPAMGSVILSFHMFINDTAGAASVDPIGLDHTGPANQHTRVDLLTSGAGVFDTGGTVIANFLLGGSSSPYQNFVIDITSLVSSGGTFVLRFAETDNQGVLNFGVDNVSVDAEAPEPGAFVLLGSGVLALAVFRLRLK